MRPQTKSLTQLSELNSVSHTRSQEDGRKQGNHQLDACFQSTNEWRLLPSFLYTGTYDLGPELMFQ